MGRHRRSRGLAKLRLGSAEWKLLQLYFRFSRNEPLLERRSFQPKRFHDRWHHSLEQSHRPGSYESASPASVSEKHRLYGGCASVLGHFFTRAKQTNVETLHSNRKHH